MFEWIYTTPLIAAAIMMALLFVGFTWLGSVFLAPIFRLFVRRGTDTNNIVGNILSSFGVLYGILLGLTAVAAYQNWADVDAKIAEEANAILSLNTDTATYPQPYQDNIRNAMVELTGYTVNEEWDLMRKGQFVTRGGQYASQLQDALLSFEPITKNQEIIQQTAIAHFNTLVEKRRLRLYAVTAGIPAVLWYVVIIGSIFNIILIWLLDMKLIAQLFLGGLLAFFLGAMILMIARLDKPFQSEDGVSPNALVVVHQVLKLQTEGKPDG